MISSNRNLSPIKLINELNENKLCSPHNLSKEFTFRLVHPVKQVSVVPIN